MTKVKDLIEYLKTLPEDMLVCVVREYDAAWSTQSEWVDLVLPDEDRYSPNVTELNTQVWQKER